MSAAGRSQGTHCPPSGDSAAATAASVGVVIRGVAVNVASVEAHP